MAVALARLGTDAGFVGGLSTDFLGDMLRERLTAEGVDLSRASFLDNETTLGLVSLDGLSPRYVFYDQASAGRYWQPSPASLDLSGVAAVHFGSVTLIGEPSGERFESYQHQASGRCLVSLDPNCRPTLVREIDAYRARIDRMARRSDIVRMSAEDLDYLYPNRPTASVARDLLASGTLLVVITHGEDGAEGFLPCGSVRVPAKQVTVVDTIAAGDSFYAALLACLAETDRLDRLAISNLTIDELEAILSFAAQAAAVTCTRPGADPPRRADLANGGIAKRMHG